MFREPNEWITNHAGKSRSEAIGTGNRCDDAAAGRLSRMAPEDVAMESCSSRLDATRVEATAPEDYLRSIIDDPNESEFPPIVSVEVSSVCNLKCPICPHPAMQRAKDHMDPGLFRRVVAELADERIELFQPQGVGETFLHPEWPDLLREARAAIDAPILMITNATLLTPERIELLLDCPPDGIILGLDGASGKVYHEVRFPAVLEKTEQAVAELLEQRAERGLRKPRIFVRVIRTSTNATEVDAIRARWEPRLSDNDAFLVGDAHTWGGRVADPRPSDVEPPRATPVGVVCRMLSKSLTVLQNGDVTPCCYDIEGEMRLGNVRDASLRELWNGDELARYRRLHAEERIHEIRACHGCDAFVAGPTG